MFVRLVLALAGAMMLAACNPVAQVEDGKGHIKNFQALYNKGDAEGIYRESGATFRKNAKPEQLEAIMGLFAARLGKIESSEQAGFNTAFNNGVITTTITMKTRFTKGEATETYVFEGSGADMKLAGWNVNSPLLALTADDLKAMAERKSVELAAPR